jgi:hypothetical protein
MEDNSFKIYSLSDPREPEKVRYIGQTCKSLKTRLSRHIDKVKREYPRNHRVCWINSLLKEGVKPIIYLIEDDLSKNDAFIKEQHYIKIFKSFGCKLVNTSEGGEYHHTSDESRKKISEKNTKIKITKEELYNMYVVKEMTQKEIAQHYKCYESTIAYKRKKYGIPSRKGHLKRISEKISKNHIGKKQSDIHRKHNSEATKRRYKPLLQKDELENLLLIHKSLNKLSKIINVNRNIIKKMLLYYQINADFLPKRISKPNIYYKPLLTKEKLLELYNKFTHREISEITKISISKIKYMLKYYKITITKYN